SIGSRRPAMKSALGLKPQLQREFKHTRRPEREDAGAESQAVAARLLAGSAVHRSDRPAQDAAERISRPVKIREVHHVKEGNSRLQLKVLPVFIDPAEVDVECPQPAHPGFVVGRGWHYLLHSLQRGQLSLGEQSTVDQNVSGGSWLTGEIVVVV